MITIDNNYGILWNYWKSPLRAHVYRCASCGRHPRKVASGGINRSLIEKLPQHIIFSPQKQGNSCPNCPDARNGVGADSGCTGCRNRDDSISDTWVDNASIAATLLQLAVVAEGLGSCWVHINGRPHRTGSEMSASDYLKTFIPIPENLSPLCVVAIGHPTPDYKFVPHKELYSEKVIEL